MTFTAGAVGAGVEGGAVGAPVVGSEVGAPVTVSPASFIQLEKTLPAFHDESCASSSW
jgi:hypothetical protein